MLREQEISNNPRMVKSVVGIEAWPGAVDDNTSSVNVHLDLVFKEGRIGEELDLSVSFRLSIKKAVLRLRKLGDSKKMKIDRVSFQDAYVPNQEITNNIQKASSGKTDSSVAVGLNLGAYAKANNANKRERSKTVKTVSDKRDISHQRSYIGSGSYEWELDPILGPCLKGSVFDEKQRLFSIRCADSKYEESIIFEVECMEENLRIDDIKISDEYLEKYKDLKSFYDQNEIRRAVAICYLKEVILRRLGLNYEIKSNRFSKMLLADCVLEIPRNG